MLKKSLKILFKYYGVYRLNIRKHSPHSLVLSDDFELKEFTADDLFYFSPLGLNDSYIHIYEKRFKSNRYKCYGVIDRSSNKLAYYAWICLLDVKFVKEINRNFKLKQKQAVLFEDDNTTLEYRGKGIHSYVMEYRIQQAKKQGVKSVYIIVYKRNIPALKTIKKFKFKRVNINPFYFRKEFMHELKLKFNK